MSKADLQDKIIETIESIVNHRINEYSTPQNKIGVVVEEPDGFDCDVKIGLEVTTCLLPEHLQTWIQKGDVVLIQDLYGDGVRFTITGKTGSTMETPQLVFSDQESNKNISGVDGIFNEETGERLNTAGTVLI